MKKILFVASTSNHLVTFHMPYINKLKEKYEVKIMAKDENYKFADYDIDFTKRIFSGKHLKTINTIAKILQTENFDAIILNTALASFLVRWALKKLKNRPLVINIVHGYFFSEKMNPIAKYFYKWAERSGRKQTDYILVMNDEDYDLAIKYKLCQKKVFKIKGMGIDQTRFENNHKKIEYVSVDNPKFVFIGELSKRKNQMFLIKFINELNKYNIKASLKLVGEGSYRAKLEKKIKKLNLENQIKLVGFDKDIRKYLTQADYYICASVIEGLPFNILEAMYAGCVILSSDIKGSVDVIKDYETGILYKLNDLNDLITKFRLLNNSIELKIKLAKNAHMQIDQYLLKNVFGENIEIIEGIIDGNRK